MKYLIIILALIVTGCSGGGGGSESKKKKVVIYGDSKCAYSTTTGDTYPDILDIKDKCIGGKQLIDQTYLSDKYDTIFLAYGHNDAYFDVDIDLFREHLKYLIDGIEGKVYCILPAWNYVIDVTLYRNVLWEECKYTINPNVMSYAKDGVHFTRENHIEMAEVIDEYI